MATFTNLTSVCERCGTKEEYTQDQVVIFELTNEPRRVLPLGWAMLDSAISSPLRSGAPTRHIQELCPSCARDGEAFMAGSAVRAVPRAKKKELGDGGARPKRLSQKPKDDE